MGLCFCLIDATNFYQHFDPYFQVDTKIDAPFPLPLAAFLTHYGLGFLHPRLVRIAVLLGQQCAVFTIIHWGLAVIHISFGGLGILDDWCGGMGIWPVLVGSPLIIVESGLREFWGRGWHHILRNVSLLTCHFSTYYKTILTKRFLVADKSCESNGKGDRRTAEVIICVYYSRVPPIRSCPCCKSFPQCPGREPTTICLLLLDPGCLCVGRGHR